MRILITGGTGLIGSMLVRNLLRQGHKLTVLTRDTIKAKQKFSDEVEVCETLDFIDTLDGYNAIINLAGEPMLGKRWTERQKEKLCNSRWDITERLTHLIKKSNNPPKIFISGSAIGYYGAQDNKVLDENAPFRDDFTHQLCEKWERMALDAQSERTRVCIIRTGIVLSKEGGMLPAMLLPFRLGLGATFGKGNQYISWIHIQDMVNAIIFMLDMPEARGVFNVTAPNPVTNKRFANVLSTTIYRPRLFRIPSFLLKMIIGESATMITEGQRVVPKRLLELHFRFVFEHLDESLKDIIGGKNRI
ncbi:MAG: TIGR01777 family oxidoreductase [Dysgonomonas sp.]